MKLSKPIDTYVQAINAGDAAALQSSFADHAVVKDVGREFRGIAAIAASLQSKNGPARKSSPLMSFWRSSTQSKVTAGSL